MPLASSPVPARARAAVLAAFVAEIVFMGMVAAALLYGFGFWLLPSLFPRWLAPFWLPPTGRALQAVAHLVYGVAFGLLYRGLAPRPRSDR